jgi:hypothetical protein
MVSKEVFVNFYNFSPVWAVGHLQHASIHVRKYWYSVKKVIVKVSFKIYSEPEPQFRFAAP